MRAQGMELQSASKWYDVLSAIHIHSQSTYNSHLPRSSIIWSSMGVEILPKTWTCQAVANTPYLTVALAMYIEDD
jgi:hypothetical protein